MRFVGEVNVLPAEALGSAQAQPRVAAAVPASGGDGASLFIRPHDLDLLEEPGERSVPAVVRRLVHLGRDVHAELQLDEGHLVQVQIPRDWLHAGQRQLEAGARLHLRPRSVRSFSS
jgi:sulfate transport system ATP-binding protein